MPIDNEENLVFYKYMSAATAHAVLGNQTLRWSTPGTLNDPYDMQFDLRYEVDRDVVRRLALNKLWEAYCGAPVAVGNILGLLIQALRVQVPNMQRAEFETEHAKAIFDGLDRLEAALPRLNADVRGHLATSKILCLTETPDNSVMWTHYADTHRGVVIRLRDYPELDSPYRTAKPVKYVAEAPHLVDAEFLADMLSGRTSFDTNALLERLVYTKSADWAYEREWRIYSGNGRNKAAAHEDLRFGSFELDAVLFGLNTSDESRSSLTQLVRKLYPHAELLCAKRNPDAFGMIFTPVDE
ncbi:hypothetical protein B0G71_0715 [Paraburkholderia sp. BL27I4N3]|uniref:DUF2971 domain-containing protein n=1 Tax=Paraburkholderia sp. BL27I4N3 TaxID=1938805 RepID=UPI000E266747|nr:DUF2971 domain-containing protein [Paraburkholderia sp. BL27I4N3]REE17750.1 hypothetical protein B0G71_0715 [Paraburkholderia sp. BL27I4N3]